MKYYLSFVLLLIANFAFAQTDSIPLTDINPVIVAEETPRFPGCEILMDSDKTRCSEEKLLQFIYQNINYPDTAVANQIEGTVVVRFVVTKSGSIAQIETLKDIGYDCGKEAMRVVNLMNLAELEWIPGKVKGEVVDCYFTIPIRFKIQEPLPYVLMGRDTIWTEFTEGPGFEGGEEALQKFITDNLRYPPSGLDSCEVGDIACEILIRKNGQPIVMSTYNYSSLNQEFEFEIARIASRTLGQWNIAQLDGKKVAALYPVRFKFRPTGNNCGAEVRAFELATTLTDEGLNLYNEGNLESALAKWAEAINVFPASVEASYLRGQAYLENNQFPEACADLTAVKAVLGTSGYDNLLPFICK